ncbi:MAG: hypothetical protein AABY22_24605, partial [Nanoarchaeota archaeon]
LIEILYVAFLSITLLLQPKPRNSFFILLLGASNIKSFRRLKIYIIIEYFNYMKLQKRFLRKHKNKDYYKYIVNIPPMAVKEAGLEYGDNLEIEIGKGKILLTKKKE